jgi:hypothetical protein
VRSRSALFVLAALQTETAKCLYFILVSAEGACTDAARCYWRVPDRITHIHVQRENNVQTVELQQSEMNTPEVASNYRKAQTTRINPLAQEFSFKF